MAIVQDYDLYVEDFKRLVSEEFYPLSEHDILDRVREYCEDEYSQEVRVPISVLKEACRSQMQCTFWFHLYICKGQATELSYFGCDE